MLVIFDYFGVIAQDRFWYGAQEIAAANNKSEHMQELNREVNSGEIAWDDFCAAVARDIGKTVEEVRGGYQDHRITPDIVRLIQTVRAADHTVVLLSNASGSYLYDVMEKLGLTVLFDRVFMSSDIGYMKPDPRAYTYVLSTMGCDATEAVMIDDNQGNIIGAQDLGMQGIVFESTDRCRTELVRLGVL